MSLTDVLPDVQSLSRLDKIRLIHVLARELEQNEDGLIEPGRSYPIWSPDTAFTAAEALLKALEEEKRRPFDERQELTSPVGRPSQAVPCTPRGTAC